MARIVPLSDAVAELVRDGDSVALEGFTHLIPFAAGHELLRQGRRELELIRMTPDILYDQMIGMGAARRLGVLLRRQPGRRLAAPLPRRDRARLAAPDRDRGAQPRRHGQPLRGGRGAAAVRGPARLRGHRPGGAHDACASSSARSPASGSRRSPALRPGRRDRPRAGGRPRRQRAAVGDPRGAEGGGRWPRGGRWSRSSGSSSGSSRARRES